jgi:hypothetical protein
MGFENGRRERRREGEKGRRGEGGPGWGRRERRFRRLVVRSGDGNTANHTREHKCEYTNSPRDSRTLNLRNPPTWKGKESVHLADDAKLRHGIRQLLQLPHKIGHFRV